MALGGQSQTWFFSSFFAAKPQKKKKKGYFWGIAPPNPRFAKRQAAKVDAYASNSPLNGYVISGCWWRWLRQSRNHRHQQRFLLLL
jgi:hypothetical protein